MIEKKRIEYLDVLRTVAIIGVITIHSCEYSPTSFAKWGGV